MTRREDAVTSQLASPFIWFGGKRRVASRVWAVMGDVEHYVEPFFGSGAVLLGRPRDHMGRTETVNDADSYVSNFWRAVTTDPDAVAAHADWPVNETDLFARHLWLVNEGRDRLIAGLETDPEWYDAKIAGWWVWGINAWIGSGWCSGTGPWVAAVDDDPLNRKLPHLGDGGQGGLPEYFAQLADRLRLVRVCCGDWSRVCTQGALSYGTTVGVFLDPPYSGNLRATNLYACDDHDIAADVRDWAIANGDNPRLRIVLAGYEAEHIGHMPANWRMVAYSSSRAYGTAKGDRGAGNALNRHQERLWYSPHCLSPIASLFDGMAL